MRKIAFLAIFMCSITLRASMFGEENAPLYAILANAIQQLASLNSMLKTGGDTLGLIREINQGINDSLNMLRTIDPNSNPGIYSDWANAQSAFAEVERIYGSVPSSTSETTVQRDVDQSVAEAVTLNNAIYDYSREIDRVGEEIKAASHTASPGGAQKLTAESLGVMLHVMNSSLRAQATALKLQAQSMEVQNRRDKAQTQHTVNTTNSIQNAFGRKAKFELPRF